MNFEESERFVVVILLRVWRNYVVDVAGSRSEKPSDARWPVFVHAC